MKNDGGQTQNRPLLDLQLFALIQGVDPRPPDPSQWVELTRKQSNAFLPSLLRTIFENRSNADNRVIVDVYENESRLRALEFLEELIARCSAPPIVIGAEETRDPAEKKTTSILKLSLLPTW